MSDDNDKKETALIALLIFHQFLIEGYKAWLRAQFNNTAQKLVYAFRQVFSRIAVDSMSDLTKAELNELTVRLARLQSPIYDSYLTFVMQQLKLLGAFETATARQLFIRISGKEPETPHSSVVMMRVRNTPLGANGMLLIPFSGGFGASSQELAKLELVKAYTNGDTPRVTELALIGVKSRNFRDGLIARIFGRNAAYVNTAVQHVSSIAQATVASVFYDQYQWLSIMDSHTTPICRSRNKAIYYYGQGPLPPAHMNCRSKTSPITDAAIHNDPMTVNSWLASQPTSILNVLFPPKTVAAIKAGAKYEDVGNNVRPLTIKQLSDSVKLIDHVK